MKRSCDVLLSLFCLVIFIPILIISSIFIWLQDFHSPFYLASRVGLNDKLFRMYKLRSMVVNADHAGIVAASSSDQRITVLGKLIRKYKFDELTQLVNVLKGDMSLVGPRPTAPEQVMLYNKIEKNLLTVKPGITDFSSIVFSDADSVLDGQENSDLAYHQLIRPWKSRLGLLYIEKRSFALDIKLLYLTVAVIFSRKRALLGINKILSQYDLPDAYKAVCLRKDELQPCAPPGSDEIVVSLT